MIVRRVEDRDAITLYRWMRDVETTRLSGKPNGELSWQEHLDWFVENYTNPWLYVFEDGGQLVGSVRIDAGENGPNGGGWMSIVVAPGARGLGYGKRMIREMVVRYTAPLARPIFAKIHELNAPSLRAFAANEFVEYGRDGVWRILRCG